MEKQPFTPEGVAALQAWLNQLPSLQFDAEIAAMHRNFELWALAHLELNPQQLQFYQQLSVVAKENLIYLVTLAAAYKQPISLTQEGGEEPPPEDKLFKPKSTLAITSHTGGDYDVDGELVIEVVYLS